MDKEKITSLITILRKELLSIFIALIILIMLLKIAFYKESILTIAKAGLSILWIFLLPGFLILYYWHEKLEFIERIIIGFVLGSAITGIGSYYLGLVGLQIKYHTIVIPLILLISGIILTFFKFF